MVSVEIGFFHMIAHEDSRFAFSVGGDCLNAPNYIEMLKENKIRRVVNTTNARGFSPNTELVRAGVEETVLNFIEEWYTPLPSQLERWLDIMKSHYQEGSVRIAVHGIINGPFLIAIGLMELGLGYEEAREKVLSAGGQLYQDQEYYLKTYTPRGFKDTIGKKSRESMDS